ncbi:MAG: hypothetical protein VB050_03285 [Geobacteraceae bacterium]|nr:hypothetical protein [Geobacteraceae bacterium]
MAGEKNEKSVEAILEQVKVMIQESTQGLIPKGQLKAALEEAGIVIVTEDRVREIVEEIKGDLLPSYVEGIQLGSFETQIAEKPLLPIDPKWLKGLVYRTTTVQKGEQGEKRIVPVVRDLAPDDVLDWADKGDVIVIVTADGKKHQVEKNPKAKPAEDSKE